jgi:RNA polymerase sigma-70 factor (ECF subfamily)
MTRIHVNIETAFPGGVSVAIERQGVSREAFVALVERYNDELLRLAFAMAGDRELAADAVQGCWQAAWQSRAAVRDPDRIRAWLLTITANNVRRQIRRRRLGALLGGFLSQPQPPAVDPGHIDLSRALVRLSVDDRQLLAMRFDLGLTSDEIGDVLGLSGAGTRRRLQRVLARLRQELRDD